MKVITMRASAKHLNMWTPPRVMKLSWHLYWIKSLPPTKTWKLDQRQKFPSVEGKKENATSLSEWTIIHRSINWLKWAAMNRSFCIYRRLRMSWCNFNMPLDLTATDETLLRSCHSLKMYPKIPAKFTKECQMISILALMTRRKHLIE